MASTMEKSLLKPLANPELPAEIWADPYRLLALVARILHGLGYRDANAGHVTFRMEDDTLLTNPIGMFWDELTPSMLTRIDLEGNHVDGRYAANPGVRLHLAWHAVRPELQWIAHSHPEWSTIWADLGRIPPVYDQTSAMLDSEIVLVPYSGAVGEGRKAATATSGFGSANVVLLENHGTAVSADNVNDLVLRAMALEWRCRRAWQVEAIGRAKELDLPTRKGIDNAVKTLLPGRYGGLFEAYARRELRNDPGFLDR